MQELLNKMVIQKEKREDEFTQELLENNAQLEEVKKCYEEKIEELKKENKMREDELKNTEVSFFDTVKKFERLRELCGVQKNNEEKLRSELETKNTAMVTFKEEAAKVISKLESDLQETNVKLKEKEDIEMEFNKASVLIKRAEIKIISLKESLDRSENENKRLKEFVDDLTSKFGK